MIRHVALALAVVLIVAARANSAGAQCDPPPGDAFAFLSLGEQRCPPTPLVHWAASEVTYDCRFFADGVHEIDCGAGSAEECAARCRDAAAVWNADLLGRFRYVDADDAHPVTFCSSGDGRTSLGAASQFCGGSSFGSNIIAVTLRVTFTSGPRAGEQQDADVVVNSAFGGHFTPGLFRSVVEHELGHVLGLDHPDQCGHDANVLMRSSLRFEEGDPCFVAAPTADDVAGAETIYAVVAPPVCGDADVSGAVDAVDVAIVLDAAVGLPGACSSSLIRCDVDATNAVDVIDAANVQRAAAGLSAADACAF